MSVEVLTEDFESLEDRSLDENQRPQSAGDPTSCSSGSRSSMSGWVPIIMGPRPERVYSQEVLLELRTCPLAARWPPYLNPIYRNARGVWDPDRWHLDLKRGETPPVGIAGEEGGYIKRVDRSESIPSGGPDGTGKRVRQVTERDLERVAGGEGLVLSPQRRSFQVGCQAPGSEPPEEKEPEVNLRPEVPQRRVGSGRILARDGPSHEGGGGGGSGRILPRDREEKEYPPGRQEDRNRNERNRGARDDRDDTKYGFRRDHEDDRRGGNRSEEWDKDDRRQPPSGYLQHDDRRGDDRRDRRDDRDRPGMPTYRGDDRRRDPRDDHRDQDRWGNRRGDNRNDGRNDRRGRQQSYNEPEWMTESVSKNDMIELRGFEDPKKEPAAPPPALPPGSISVEDLEREQRNAPAPSREALKQPRPPSPRTSTQNLSSMLDMDPAIINTDAKKPSQEGSFNFDDIMESIPGLNSIFGGPPGPADNPAQPQPPQNNGGGQSRFAQMFQRGVPGDQGGPQPPPGNSSRRSSIQDELLGANILREINGEPAIRIPSPSESQRFFAPISPAAQTSANSNPLLDMINKGQVDAPHGSMAHLMKNYKNLQAVEDIEAGIKRQLGLQQQQQQQQQQSKQPQMPPMPNIGNMQQHNLPGLHQADRKDDELSAFKKLVAQMGPGPVLERPPPMMGGGFQQPPNARMVHPGGFPPVPGLVKPAPLPAGIPPNAPTEQEILEGLMGGRKANGHRGPPRPPQSMVSPQLSQYLGRMPLNRELLSRPEADHLMMGLNNGTITVDNLVQQLNNTALQQRQRDLLLNVLKLKTMAPPQLPRSAPGPHQSFAPPHLTVSSVGGQRGTSPLPDPLQSMLLQQQQANQAPSMLLQQQQAVQAARVSPLMFPHAPAPPHSSALAVSPVGNSARSALSVSPVPSTQRVPSPQEMTIITQQIMQQALIKRKLEEQKENFRRRQGDQGDENDTNTGSPSGPLAFTPTSVMRKTAAERRDSDPRPSVPEVKVTPQKEDGGKAPLDRPLSSPSPGKRPAVLDLGQGRIPGMQQQRPVSPSRQMPPMGVGPPMSGFPMPHTNPLLYLQNQINPGISPALISQANSMAQQQMAAANLAHQVARGVDPRLMGQRLPPPMFGQGPPSPRMQRQQQPQGGLGGLGRFFSPEVLAQAQQGTLPPMPPLPTQKALTLEEIERQAAAVRI